MRTLPGSAQVGLTEPPACSKVSAHTISTASLQNGKACQELEKGNTYHLTAGTQALWELSCSAGPVDPAGHSRQRRSPDTTPQQCRA